MNVYIAPLLLSLCLPTVLAKGLWASFPATYENIMQESYPLGNGRLGGKALMIGDLKSF
jgi:hypothetical protein